MARKCYYWNPQDLEEGSKPAQATEEVGGLHSPEGALNLRSVVNNPGDEGHLNQDDRSPEADMETNGDDSDQEPGEQDPEGLYYLETGRQRRRQNRRRHIHFQFTQWQVEELEAVFKETQYPDVLTRKMLSRSMNVPETKIKIWFNNRRAKQRNNERKAMSRNAATNTRALGHICMMDMDET